MGSIRGVVLTGVALCYMVAFSSLYIQLPGLYGDQGVMPVKHVLKSEPSNIDDLMSQMSLLRYRHRHGLDTESAMDLLCLLGMLVSFLATVSTEMQSSPVFLMLWILYMSLYSVGQTFLWFQWDILLLEVGFLAVLVAPLRLFFLPTVHHHDRMTMWLVKWLLFRLMYASGTVKLLSNCPAWWGLTVPTILMYLFTFILSEYYVCIPTPLGWYFHHLPQWFKMLSTAMVFIIQIPGSFLFFAPYRNLRWFTFGAQVGLQILIILTGNYNFFNWLTIVLCFALIEDDDCSCKKGTGAKKSHWLSQLTCTLLSMLVYALLAVFSVRYFSLNVDNSTVQSKIAFSQTEFKTFTKYAVEYSIWIAVASLCWEVVNAVYNSMAENGCLKKLYSLVCTLAMTAVVASVFCISLVPHTVVDRSVQSKLPQPITELYDKVDSLQLVNSYGLFRSMTGVGGRPEVVLLGSDDMKNWKEYEFLYKPGDVHQRPPVVAPHQPRLDWQMWFAALGSYQRNIWLLRLVHQMMYNTPDVMNLIQTNPFPDRPPKYMKALLYTYHYTDFNSTEGWWTREDNPKEYFPASTRQQLEDFFSNQNIRISGPRAGPLSSLDKTLRMMRSLVTGVDHALFVAGFLLLALVNIQLSRRISSRRAEKLATTKVKKPKKVKKH